jgi:uncharacterized protein
VRIVDANVLLYAVNADALHHGAAKRWLDRALGGADSVGLSWIALLAFVRLSTKEGLFPSPLTLDDAMTQVEDWLAAPGGRVVAPGSSHAQVLRGALGDVGRGGNLVNDSHLVALAREHRAEIVSYDNDFSRFSGVRWRTPEELLA